MIFAILAGNILSIIEQFQPGIEESMRFDTKASLQGHTQRTNITQPIIFPNFNIPYRVVMMNRFFF